jgi:hypothetical protein
LSQKAVTFQRVTVKRVIPAKAGIQPVHASHGVFDALAAASAVRLRQSHLEFK